jgi:hypothetical protein
MNYLINQLVNLSKYYISGSRLSLSSTNYFANHPTFYALPLSFALHSVSKDYSN